MRHLLSIEDLDRADIERILDRAKSFTEVSEREIKKVPALRGRTRRQPLLRGLDAHALELRAGGQALSADVDQLRLERLQRREGRVAQGHGPDALGLRPGRDRRSARRTSAPPSSSRAGRPPRSSTPATASTSTRPRRCSTSTRCASGSARSTAEDLDRRRRPALAASRAPNILAFTQAGRRGDRLRAADADPARDRGARLRRRATRSTASARPTSSTPCGCSRSA